MINYDLKQLYLNHLCMGLKFQQVVNQIYTPEISVAPYWTIFNDAILMLPYQTTDENEEWY